jgi:hypothetical protein
MNWCNDWIPACAGMTELMESAVSEENTPFNKLSPRRTPGSSPMLTS